MSNKQQNRNNQQKKNKRKANPKPRARRAKTRVSARVSVNPLAYLSDCAKDYARCLANPFTGPLACVPNFPAVMTRKVRVFARGNFQTSSTSGFGSIVFTPSQMCANNVIAGTFTIPTYTGTVIPVNSGTTGVDTFSSNSDYAAAAFGPASNNVQFRVVGAGLRIRYTGTELNRGGQIYALTEPTHDNLNGLSVSSLVAFEECKKMNVENRDWATVLFHPTKQAADPDSANETGGLDDLEFQYEANAGTNITSDGFNYMGFIVQAATVDTAAAFDFEAYAVLEFTGQPVRGTTPSHVDPIGFSAIHAVTAMGGTLPFQGPAEKHEETFLQKVSHYASSAMSWIGSHIGTIGATVAAML